MSTFPELLTSYEQAVKLAKTDPSQAVAILQQIIADPNCPKQLSLTAEKFLANILPAVQTSEPQPAASVPSLKDSIVWVDVFGIELVKEIADRMPITDEQYQRLKADIKKRGIQVPLIVTPDFKLLCGYNRLKIAKELEIKTVPVIVKDIPPDKQIEFAVRDNVVRRHLSLKEIADYIVAENLQSVGRPKKYARTKTTAEIAETLGVSEKTVERARTFAKKVKEHPAVGRSINNVIEGTEPQDHLKAKASFTVGLDLDDNKLLSYFTKVVDQIFGLDLNNGDKIKVVTQIWRVKRR